MKNIFPDLRAELDEIRIIDTHEHFLPPKYFADGENTLMRLVKNSYLGGDCMSAGMPVSWWKAGSIVYGAIDLNRHESTGETSLCEIFPYLDLVRQTSYTRALMKGLQNAYQLDQELNQDTWRTYSSLAQEAYSEPEVWFNLILERIRIQKVILDPYYDVEDPSIWNEKISVTFHVDDFLDYPWEHPVEGKPASKLVEAWGYSCDSLENYLLSIDRGFENYQNKKGIATKIGVAYRRSLYFDNVTKQEATRAFDILMKEKDPQAVIVLGNYIVRHILQRSIEAKFVVQIHTGYNWGPLNQSDPVQLVNLFREFPQVKFVLFHGSYPYSDEAGLLLKAFSNVFMDICWMPMLSTRLTEEMLLKWYDLVPLNKLMWGGDVWSVEECFGAAILFKDVVANVMNKLMTENRLPKTQAINFAQRIMYQNATELFNIDPF